MSNKPIRIQRKRTKGWKMPPNTVYVGRPSKWGNPYISTEKYSRSTAVLLYEQYLKDYPLTDDDVSLLKGKNLACFCPLDQPCHADVLLKIANDNQ